MFLLHLLLIFLVVPVALILAALGTPLATRAWVLFVAFPLALVAFAIWRHLNARDPGAGRRGGTS